MKSINSVGIAVISGFLLICHFCTFVSCQETQETCEGNGCTWNDEQLQCNCLKEPQNAFLIRNEIAKIIQARHVPWHADGSRSVNCGVMVREGNSIIGIINCNRSSPLIVKYKLQENAPSGSIRTRPEGGWKITLVSGIEIEVIQWGDNGKFMHVHVKGLESEWWHYTGLCSVNVAQNSECPDWNCNKYRVNDSDSFFRIPEGIMPICDENSISPRCGCIGTNPDCVDPQDISISSTIKCIPKPDKGGNEYNKENDDPKSDLDEMVDRGLNMGYRFFGRVRDLNPKPVANVEDGRSRCNDALRLSPTYKLCSSKVDTSVILQFCALDENTMKEDGPAKSIATEFETVCLDNIRNSIEASTSDESSQELKDLLAKVEKLVCPSQCSQNGKCVDSKCQCNEGFTGTDCSQKIGQAPAVKEKRDCDYGFGNCT